MNIGFTFDEKFLKHISVKDWLQKTKELGTSFIELSPDLSIMPLSEYMNIVELASSLNIGINYHIPYFASKNYSINTMTTNPNAFKHRYFEFFLIIKELEKVKLDTVSHIVVHGESFSSISKKNKKNTIDSIYFLLNFIEKSNLNCNISVETLRLNNEIKVGSSREDLVDIITYFDSSRIGICLDMCHDLMNYFPVIPNFNIDFLSLVNYCHIHGYDLTTNNSHISLLNSSINFLGTIKHITENFPNLTFNLELLTDYCGSSYFEDLSSNLKLLKNLRC